MGGARRWVGCGTKGRCSEVVPRDGARRWVGEEPRDGVSEWWVGCGTKGQCSGGGRGTKGRCSEVGSGWNQRTLLGGG
ncbi:unnamed protein product [Staurois parvus]|uniref:Uncharacterized protein n=1 Tax=Staurois parvus TaxID=386267 RepID=A0ABN9AQ70_9NEOB|nr:unnamed protein product [Staurois parvus]